ncbi:GerMN domain-containing protein [Teretinema zuelzerae]|nr:GerMN domain-containing protein [Teretinema zuelzerae]
MKIIDSLASTLSMLAAKARRTHTPVQLAVIAACAAVLLALFVMHAFIPNRTRSLFSFPVSAVSSKTKTEVRYLADMKTLDEQFTLYVEELVLGPMEPGLKPLFNRGTRILRSFVRGKDAYIDLSSEALLPEAGIPDFPTARDIFKKNVCTNFRNIAKIYLYIEGVEVFGGDAPRNAQVQTEKR